MKKIIVGIIRHYRSGGLRKAIWYVRSRFYHDVIKKIKFGDFHYWLNPERVLAKRFELQLPAVDNEEFVSLGNYCVSRKIPLCEKSTIYSLGVLNDTSFDEQVSTAYNCNVYLFDPSIIATRHINKKNNKLFKFQQVGVWKDSGEIKFYTPMYGGSPSMVFEHAGQEFSAPCKTLPVLMQEYGHTSIDLIKLDIEGAAMGVLNHMLDEKIYPGQVIVEFERPNKKDAMEFFQFYRELLNLLERFDSLSYKAYVIPRERYKYFSIEMILVRNPEVG
ncbi:FkbM family methyltransferase [Lacimicrobium alkaliphilum]|uniref:Methyltransferase FkbM domain-containing protein n=1 Tax=Lacimicrobium alkaliphilum TaxID=1526571 RepID=A0ABQ1RJK9_9ALTE|nr:FkbM family methyltransferase [Lacimicrobium alkaliphilum]GGD72500.1 hypothetical protein GCM10011357_29380 [Lacimicrobium alkaliphilum]